MTDIYRNEIIKQIFQEKQNSITGEYRCFTVHFDSFSFIHTNSGTFSYNRVLVFYVILKSLKTLYEALQHVSIFYDIIFKEFFIYFLVDVADIRNY
jgi:hypothetical protein